MPLTPAGDGPEGDGDRASILIVDDLPEKLLVCRTVLEDLGHRIVCARSGREALQEVLRTEFAVVLLDVNMPDIDGFETAALIRRYKRSALRSMSQVPAGRALRGGSRHTTRQTLRLKWRPSAICCRVCGALDARRFSPSILSTTRLQSLPSGRHHATPPHMHTRSTRICGSSIESAPTSSSSNNPRTASSGPACATA